MVCHLRVYIVVDFVMLETEYDSMVSNTLLPIVKAAITVALLATAAVGLTLANIRATMSATMEVKVAPNTVL